MGELSIFIFSFSSQSFADFANDSQRIRSGLEGVVQSGEF